MDVCVSVSVVTTWYNSRREIGYTTKMPMYGGGEKRLKIKWVDVWAVRGTGALEVTDSTYALPEVLERVEGGYTE